MEDAGYDVWYDPNEVDEANHARVLRAWARPDLDITIGKVILAGDDELAPVSVRVLACDDATEIITIEILYDADTRAAVA
ncbi:MAG: hypothetical protein ACKV2O_14615 [Acidimicrobiales bacterium]